jgi:hypothetical protein
MLLCMWPSRTKLLFGLTVCGVALEMITDPPLLVGLALLMVGAFLAFWGLAPQLLLPGVRRLPRHDILIGWMEKFDDWFEGLAGAAAYNANVASKLQGLYDRGLEIKPVQASAALSQAVADWSQDVMFCLDEHLPNETFMFQTIAPGSAAPDKVLRDRLTKLRFIIGRYENLQRRAPA